MFSWLNKFSTRNFLTRPDWAPERKWFLYSRLGLRLFFFCRAWGGVVGALGSLGVLFAFAFSWIAFSEKHQLFDPVTPSAAVLVIYLAVSS